LNNKQLGNLQSKNSTHFRLDDVCITEITAITKIMAGRMLLNLGSNAQKNLHMITQQCQECQSQQQIAHASEPRHASASTSQMLYQTSHVYSLWTVSLRSISEIP
jgi:hypothetical protein